MDVRRKLVAAWRDAFNGDVPTELLSRLECEHDIEVNTLLTDARDKTWEVLSELELRMQQEKFMLQFIDEEISSNKTDNSSENTSTVIRNVSEDVDNLYAKVRKPSKSKQHDSELTDDKHPSKSDQKSLPIGQDEVPYEEVTFQPNDEVSEKRENYEVISFQPEPIQIRRESLGKKDKKKVKGSVKDKIKRFERTSSGDCDENIFEKNELESDKVLIKSTKAPPPISPRPAARKKQQQHMNPYEEIELPCFGVPEIKNKDITEAPSNTNIAVSTNPTIVDTHNDNEHKISQNEVLSGKGCDILDQSNSVSSVNYTNKEPPVRLENQAVVQHVEESDYAELRDIVEPKFSDKEPSFSSFVKSSDVKISSRGHFKPIDNGEDDDEGDYCSLSEIAKFANKHVTLVKVESGGSEKSEGEQNADMNSREKASSNLRIISSTISRSREDLSHYKDIDDDNIESITEQTEEEMKKLFQKKNKSDLNSPDTDGVSPVIGKKFKSLSSSDSDEDTGTHLTVPFSKGPLVSKPRVSNELPKTSRAKRKGVPDYESWNFQALLTNPKISAAETENLGEDTGSEDDLSPVYDNKLPTQFEQKYSGTHNGVSDSNGSTDTKTQTHASSGKYSPQRSPQRSPELRKYSIGSRASEASRVSTACMYFCFLHLGLDLRKPVWGRGGLRTTDAQTSLRIMISAFVICFLESKISKLATDKILIF